MIYLLLIMCQDGRCSMADACSNPADAEGVYLMIMQNFQRHYNTNRAPFGLYYHPAWSVLEQLYQGPFNNYEQIKHTFFVFLQ